MAFFKKKKREIENSLNYLKALLTKITNFKL